MDLNYVVAHFCLLERYDGGEKCKYYRIEIYSSYSGQKNLYGFEWYFYFFSALEVVNIYSSCLISISIYLLETWS